MPGHAGAKARVIRESQRGTLGDTPVLATQGWMPGASTFKQQGSHADAGLRGTSTKGRINLKGVAETLAEYGLDPAVEIAKILVATKPARARNGEALTDELGDPVMEPVLDTDVRLKTLLELQQYTAPKLKATEVTLKEEALTVEQIDARLKALMTRAEKGEP